ncbi:MAG: outer membrane beta-barrel protein [Candidatus Zixiibacteriota bacterium]
MRKVGSIIVVLSLVALVPFSLVFSAGKSKAASGGEEKTAKGRIELGGGVNFTHTSDDAGSATDIAVMPRVGYFVIPKLAIEPTLTFENISASPKQGGSTSATFLGAQVNVAYHFEGTSEAKYVPYVIGGLGFLARSGDVHPQNPNLVAPYLGGGIKYFFTNAALVRAELFYEHVSNAGGVQNAKADDLGLTVGVSVFVK